MCTYNVGCRRGNDVWEEVRISTMVDREGEYMDSGRRFIDSLKDNGVSTAGRIANVVGSGETGM